MRQGARAGQGARSTHSRALIVLTAVMAPALGRAQTALPEIQVIATAPLQGPAIERDKVPAMTHTVTADDIQRTYSPTVTGTLMQRVPGVSISDPQGNGAAQDLRYRGFAASPLQGTPQGLAVYLNGVRLNETFGDSVNWDLLPEVAIARADLFTANPAFGLNALGGAVTLKAKSGFDSPGGVASGQAGAFGRVYGSVEQGWSGGTDRAQRRNRDQRIHDVPARNLLGRAQTGKVDVLVPRHQQSGVAFDGGARR